MNTLTRWNPFRVTRWDPFRELTDFGRGLERFFEGLPMPKGNGEEPITPAMWEPLTDVIEDEKEYLVKMELPEVKKEEVKVTVENGALRITGERKFEKEEKTKKVHRVERSYGTFLRAFTLPEGTEGAKVTAEFKEGVLKVHLPKTEKAKVTATEVKVA
jgi:HSP20 family protein